MTDAFSSHLEDAAIAGLFSEPAWVNAFVRVEAALARAQAQAGVIPAAAAAEIARRGQSFAPDLRRIAESTARHGFPIIGFLEQFRAHVGAESGPWVHWGATTQDIVDTALVLKLREALAAIEVQIADLISVLAKLADAHRRTLMVGRTHLQPALPITFGLKTVGWLAPYVRHRQRLAEIRPRLLVVQFGGAAGTLASLGPKAEAVERALAAELGLQSPSSPWHAQRDRLLEGSGWLAVVSASLAKFAADVLWLAQGEIAEVYESVDRGGGGSSAMPQKANPARSESILVATRLVADHHASLLHVPPAEHERGTLTSQLELIHLPRMCALTSGALRNAERLASGLVVDGERMKANVAATHGVMLAEACTLALNRHLKHEDARALVREACATAITEKRNLLEILCARPEARAAVNEFPKDEADYLGSAELFIDRVLADAGELPAPRKSP